MASVGNAHVASADGGGDAEHGTQSPESAKCDCTAAAKGGGLLSKDLVHEILSKADLSTPPVLVGHTDDLSDVNPYAELVGDPSRSKQVVDAVILEDKRADRAVACMIGTCMRNAARVNQRMNLPAL